MALIWHRDGTETSTRVSGTALSAFPPRLGAPNRNQARVRARKDSAISFALRFLDFIAPPVRREPYQFMGSGAPPKGSGATPAPHWLALMPGGGGTKYEGRPGSGLLT